MKKSNLMQDLLSPKEASGEINRSTSTLAKDRSIFNTTGKQRGPRHVVIGGRIYYRREDLKAWLDQQISASLENAA